MRYIYSFGKNKCKCSNGEDKTFGWQDWCQLCCDRCGWEAEWLKDSDSRRRGVDCSQRGDQAGVCGHPSPRLCFHPEESQSTSGGVQLAWKRCTGFWTSVRICSNICLVFSNFQAFKTKHLYCLSIFIILFSYFCCTLFVLINVIIIVKISINSLGSLTYIMKFIKVFTKYVPIQEFFNSELNSEIRFIILNSKDNSNCWKNVKAYTNFGLRI